MALVKTYLLAPNFNFRPDGPIALGNIIADPFRPKRVLTAPDPNKPKPAIETVTEYDYLINRDAGRGSQIGVWAQFLHMVKGNVRAECGNDVITEYKIDALKTSYFKTEPTGEEIAERVKAPLVQSAIRSGVFRSEPVYMITGVKIAEGFSASSERASHRASNVGASVPLSAEVSVGVDINLSARNSQRDAFRAGNDIVFAYQLMKIVQKGWKEKTLAFDDYYPKAAYLNDDFEEEEEDGEIVASYATAADLLEVNAEEISLREAEVQDGEYSCVCISFNER